MGELEKAKRWLGELRNSQAKDGAIFAACHDGVSTGFEWQYFHRAHIGATAWYVLAEHNHNPFR